MDVSLLRERGNTEVMTVSELNSFIKTIFDTNRALSSLYIKGEISNLTLHRSGHIYFSLKDGESQIRAVMFRSMAQKLKFMPENGMKVLARGSVTVYQRDGSYQFYANSLEPDGLGALYVAFEQLKKKLEAEGLFCEENKKEIPRMPTAIGVITSPSGAAVRDIINVVKRRYPIAKIYVYPALVQGEGAEQTLICGLDYFDKSGLVDTVIIGRGGGSVEDLWAFNGELLARRIFEMTVPVISAVGHERDYTICDFVADLRAPTPSAAAELAVPDIREIYTFISSAEARLEQALLRLVERRREWLDGIMQREVFCDPARLFELKASKLSEMRERLSRSYSENVGNSRNRLAVISGKLNAMSPLSVLERGYSVVRHNKKVLRNAERSLVGEKIDVRVQGAEITALVEEVREVN